MIVEVEVLSGCVVAVRLQGQPVDFTVLDHAARPPRPRREHAPLSVFPDKINLTRPEIAQVLGAGVRFHLHAVSFADLARGSAYTLQVDGLTGGDAITAAEFERTRALRARVQSLKGHTYKGRWILVD